MSNFRVGQKVVCIEDIDAVADAEKEPWETYPVKGEVYTVRGFDFEDGPCLFLMEIVNPVMTYRDGEAGEASFGVQFFRPVVERKTDISIFTKMLDGPRVRETALTKG